MNIYPSGTGANAQAGAQALAGAGETQIRLNADVSAKAESGALSGAQVAGWCSSRGLFFTVKVRFLQEVVPMHMHKPQQELQDTLQKPLRGLTQTLMQQPLQVLELEVSHLRNEISSFFT